MLVLRSSSAASFYFSRAVLRYVFPLLVMICLPAQPCVPGSSLGGDGAARRPERSPRQAARPVRPHKRLPLPIGHWRARSPPIHRKRNESRAWAHARTHDPSHLMQGNPHPDEPPARRTYERCGGGPRCPPALAQSPRTCHLHGTRVVGPRQSGGRPGHQPKGGGARGRGDRRSYWPLSLAPRACAKDLAGAYKILLQAVDSTGRDGIRRVKGELALPVSGVHASFFDRNRRR